MAYSSALVKPGPARHELLSRQYGGQDWQIHLQSACSAEFIASLAVERGLGIFSDHNPILERERLRQVAERPDGNVCLAYTEAGFIVGYVAFYLPERDNRWGRSRLEVLYELGAVEVSRHWRGLRLGKSLLRFAGNDPAFENLIVISQEFSWHWDLRSSGLSAEQYRQKLMEIMAAGGFVLYETTEPNIAYFPHNFFMARLGAAIRSEDRQAFLELLQTDPETDDFFDDHGF